jgi:LacI family repressor for deo operon, udp, cdd, tsx, nupC, and nupG
MSNKRFSRNNGTIKDVARLAGVSTATVSRTLKQPEKVTIATRKKVMQAVVEVDYTPNAMAQSLRTQVTKTVILVVRDIANPFYLEIFRGVEQQAHDLEYSVLMGNTRDDPEREQLYFNMVHSRHADGLILMTGKLPPALNQGKQRLPPMVIALEYLKDVRLPTVLIDNVQSSRRAVEHLISLGHRRIAHISGPVPEILSMDREEGYRLTLQENGITINEEWVVNGNFSVRSGHRAMHQLLASDPRPTAIFAANDEMAIGAINELAARGIKVPQDVSVIGFDDISFARAYNPSLTTIRQLRTEIGRQAVLLLADVLAGKPVSSEPVIIPTELVVRDSSGIVNEAYRTS